MTIQNQIEGFQAIIKKLHQIANLPRLDYRGKLSSLNSRDFTKLYFDEDNGGNITSITYVMCDNYGDDESFEVTLSELEQPLSYFEGKFQKKLQDYKDKQEADKIAKAEAERLNDEKQFEQLKQKLGK